MKSNFKYKLYILAQIGFVQSIWAGTFLENHGSVSRLFDIFTLGDRSELEKLDNAFSIIRDDKANEYEVKININILCNCHKLLFNEHCKAMQKALIINLIHYCEKFEYKEYHYFILSSFSLEHLNLKEIIFLILIIAFVSEYSESGLCRQSAIGTVIEIYNHFF